MSVVCQQKGSKIPFLVLGVLGESLEAKGDWSIGVKVRARDRTNLKGKFHKFHRVPRENDEK